MNRRPTDLRRYVLVRNLKRYVKAHEGNASSNGNEEAVDPKQESISNPNMIQETTDPPVVDQENLVPHNVIQEIPQAGTSWNSEETTLSSSPSGSAEETENSSTEDSAASKDTDLNTSAFAIVASLFKPRNKRKKGIAKAKTVVKSVKTKKPSSLACVKEKEPVSKKPRSLFSLFKTRKEKRNNALGSKTNNPSNSASSSTPETTSQSCQTDITWPDDGIDELHRSNQVLQESNRLLIENLSTLIQNISTTSASSQPRGICTDAYGCESVNYSVEPQPSYSGSNETEPKSPMTTRSHTSKLHRSQTLMESCKSYKICTRSKSMLNPDRRYTPVRTYTQTPPNNFLHSSTPYQLRSTILKDLPVNTPQGLHNRSLMPERSSQGPMRPLLRRRSNNFFDYNQDSVFRPSLSNAAHKPLSENLPFNKVRKPIVRRSSMPDRVPRVQMNYQRQSAVQRRNTLSYQDKRSYKRSDYNCSTRFQDLPNEAFY